MPLLPFFGTTELAKTTLEDVQRYVAKNSRKAVCNRKGDLSQLGYASIQVTTDRCGHLLLDVHQQATQRLKESPVGSSIRKPLENP